MPKPLLKLVTCLVLLLTAINPAFALQYMPTQMAALNAPASNAPRAVYIHASQQQAAIRQLEQQGYTVISANRADAEKYLADSRTTSTSATTENTPAAGNSPASDCHTPLSNTSTDNPAGDPAEPDEENRSRGSVSHSQGMDLSDFNFNSGGSDDSAKLMFILIGVVIIAVLIIYVGKFINEIANNAREVCYWWHLNTFYNTLTTLPNQHGNFSGLKLSVGVVADATAEFGLSAELGELDLDLIYNRESLPSRITTRGSYWLAGPTIRWNIEYTDNLTQSRNKSQVYLELLGGTAEDKTIKILGIARLGFNVGLGKNARLGFNYGAFYLGLNEDQGPANDGTNYWEMFGMELGYQFD
ncbi:MAG: hypothetical protein OEZ39_01920 [Gammaproteobacteria bacterium]|nr:hypothetical protein [Gammaproteobacteria bacterium]MDH5650611.1 hypothetical protein [Gammaproteobacteria bacterium]